MATEATLRNTIATWLNQYKGIKEGSSEHKAILKIFNDSKLCTRYTMTTSDAWCAAGVSADFIANDMTDIFPCVECSCAKMITLAKSAGIWEESDSYAPKVGDVILYDWDDSGSGDNTGTPDHVGIVQSVSGTSFVVIECNKSDTVGTRSMTVNGKYIRGFILPDYASKATTSGSSGSKTVAELAEEVIAGKWGNGDARKSALETAGYDYSAVQAEVNNILNGSAVKSSGSSGSTDSNQTVTKQVKASAAAQKFDKSLAGTYKTTANLYCRNNAGTGYKALCLIPKGTSVQNYGYYSLSGSTKWLYIQFTMDGVQYTGFSCVSYLKKQ